ncbi:hypothetical protein [Leadbettera azotonutricia]|uniref:Uncharacterized protein n=1 Tax=Leadbettera azotonutricia (strain ATCC BAA-888 / DSM 13862 / ZAS-9) TaxID=545695 RepID=F5Y8X3_LEAAZ|nr:hypothetical protein [Leadbettera azotonutricia]AEF81338.1 conserved hypothetical protein [Leadbettera azotonutricia ZAS-9]
MFMEDYFIVYPEGDTQEVQGRLSLNQIVDVNGNPLPLPLSTNKMIAFKVARVSSRDYKGGTETRHFLELMSADELLEYVRR